MGRKAKEFTDEEIEMIKRLSELFCNKTEIAYVMGVDRNTLYKYADEWIAEGNARGKVKLRRAQWRNAIDNENVTMQIWLGKNILGQSDSPGDGDENLVLPWEINTGEQQE